MLQFNLYKTSQNYVSPKMLLKIPTLPCCFMSQINHYIYNSLGTIGKQESDRYQTEAAKINSSTVKEISLTLGSLNYTL